MVSPLGGLLPPVVTPLRDGRPDPDAIERFVALLSPHLDGMVVCGSVGEGPSLGMEARQSAARAFAKALQGRGALVLGCAATSLEDLRRLIRLGEELDVDGYLIPVPFYYRHTPASVREFYHRIVSWTERAIIVYDNPTTTKTTLTAEELVRIGEDHPQLRHVKLTDPDLEKAAALADRVRAFAGSDEVMHHQVTRGCVGAMTGLPQIFPHLARAWFDALQRGDEREARRHYDHMAPLAIELMVGPDRYPAIIKHALWRLGVIPEPDVLPPLLPLDELRRREVDLVLELSRERAGRKEQ